MFRRKRREYILARLILDAPNARHWGYTLWQLSGVRSGAMYRILHRWHDAGWLSDGWEDSMTIENRPPRRYYEVTPIGQLALEALVANLRWIKEANAQNIGTIAEDTSEPKETESNA